LPLVGEALIPVEPGVQIGRVDALPELLSSGRMTIEEAEMIVSQLGWKRPVYGAGASSVCK
jgi:hypothetical protein